MQTALRRLNKSNERAEFLCVSCFNWIFVRGILYQQIETGFSQKIFVNDLNICKRDKELEVVAMSGGGGGPANRRDLAHFEIASEIGSLRRNAFVGNQMQLKRFAGEKETTTPNCEYQTKVRDRRNSLN